MYVAGTFDLLVYTDASSDVPTEWEDSDPRFIQNAADVKLRSFPTKVSCMQINCITKTYAATKLLMLNGVSRQALHGSECLSVMPYL